MAVNMNQKIISISLQRPAGWAQRQQRVVIVRDCSPSMEGDKADAAGHATKELCHILALPTNRDGFHIAVVDFHGKARVVHELEKATALHMHLRPLRVGAFASGTNITSGLKHALSLLQRAEENQTETTQFARSVVVLLSDGEHNSGHPPYRMAEALKQIADLVCIAYGDDADLKLLRRLATSPKHCVQCSAGEELRHFFVQVGVTLTRTLAGRSDATVALAHTCNQESERLPHALPTS